MTPLVPSPGGARRSYPLSLMHTPPGPAFTPDELAGLGAALR